MFDVVVPLIGYEPRFWRTNEVKGDQEIAPVDMHVDLPIGFVVALGGKFDDLGLAIWSSTDLGTEAVPDANRLAVTVKDGVPVSTAGDLTHLFP